MSKSEYTPGRLTIGEPFLDDEGYREIPIYASVPGVPDAQVTPFTICLQFPGLDAMQDANAARLVACWHACTTVPTETLLLDYKQGYDPWSHVKHLEGEVENLRDALLRWAERPSA